MTPRTRPLPWGRALERLRHGNSCFVRNLRSVEALASQVSRDALVAGQAPFAVVLSCSDSRVPAELVFDCGLGDLFVVRVAGNVVAPPIVGSVEFAVQTFGTELVVIMGHTRCGAVAATLDTLLTGKTAPSDAIRDILERVGRSLAETVRWHGQGHDEALMRAATRANVRAAVDQLCRDSFIVERRIAEGRLAVVGAEYELESGRVDFFEGLDLPLPRHAAPSEDDPNEAARRN